MNLRVKGSDVMVEATFHLASSIDVTARRGGENFSTQMIEVRFDSDGEAYVDGYERGTGGRRLASPCAVEVLDGLGYPAQIRMDSVYLVNRIRIF